ncbi:uncharacterized protein LOC124670580 [Lolium rigidum]|uniref:uncharacterized protein LOC124670580 n=1 Tax=Lolium rigidum TaxID=89674 RepID=UPI001F5E3556|nr:uncharacterized protein LOC124670580 [Lolium rigidum]
MKWRKVLKETYTLQTAGRFCRRHPSVLCLLLCVVILYKYYFSWFSLLVATSPILLLTGFFLGIILAYGEPNNPDNDHIYKKIQKAPQTLNIHDNAKSVGDVSRPQIPSSQERLVNHKNSEKKIHKGSHGRSSSSESVSGASDGSETDTHPMLHAFHQLRSTTSSSVSSHDGDSGSNSTEDETENQDDNDESRLEKKDGVKVVAWTADDQKNILKIGCLEIERNQRLETLIARRRARKYVNRNLIDFDSSESLPTVEELSKFNVQLPTVFAPRRNPLNLPYDEDNFPESAPSAPLKMRNTFQLPGKQEDESSSTRGDNLSNVEPGTVAPQPQKNRMLRRHESFTEGAPFITDFWQDLQPSRFRPYFVTETTDNDGFAVPILERETSAKSSVQDSNSTASAADQEIQKELLEDSSNQGHGPSFSQIDEQSPSAQYMSEDPLALDIDPPVLISESSDDDMSLPDGHIHDWEEAQGSENLNLSHLEDLSVMQYPQEMEMTSNDFHQISPHSDDLESMSSSTEATGLFEVNNIELTGRESEIDETQIGDPIYDSSPSGTDKPTSMGSPIDAVFLQEGNAHNYSDAQASKEEEGSPSRIEVPSNEIFSPNLSSMEAGRQNGTSEIMDHAIVDHGVHTDSLCHPDPAVSDISSRPVESS